MAQAARGQELPVGRGIRDDRTVRPGDRPVVAVVDHQQGSPEVRDEPIGRQLLPVDSQPRGQALAHQLAHVAGKAEQLTDLHREVDDVLRRGHHHQPTRVEAVPGGECRRRRSERVCEHRVKWSHGSPYLKDRPGVVDHVRAGAVGLSVGRCVEGDHPEAALDEWIDEHSQAGRDAAPAMEEQDRRSVAPGPGGQPAAAVRNPEG